MNQLSSLAQLSASWRSFAAPRSAARLFVAVAAFGVPITLALSVTSSLGAAPQGRAAFVQDGENFAPVDSDGDGLDDALESGQATAFDRVDSDGDGWNDAEELARGSHAAVFSSQPGPGRCSVGVRAYLRDGKLHATFATYIASGSMDSARLDIGIYAFGRMITLPPATYMHRMTLTTVPTKQPGGLMLVSDFVLPQVALLHAGSMSVYGTLRIGGVATSAASTNLVMRGQTACELVQTSQISPAAAEQIGPGIIYRPLGGATAPITWSSGEICVQRMNSVGTRGAVVTQEVTAASCISGWDGFCDGGSCSSSVGTTVDLVDPMALVGG